MRLSSKLGCIAVLSLLVVPAISFPVSLSFLGLDAPLELVQQHVDSTPHLDHFPAVEKRSLGPEIAQIVSPEKINTPTALAEQKIDDVHQLFQASVQTVFPLSIAEQQVDNAPHPEQASPAFSKRCILPEIAKAILNTGTPWKCLPPWTPSGYTAYQHTHITPEYTQAEEEHELGPALEYKYKISTMERDGDVYYPTQEYPGQLYNKRNIVPEVEQTVIASDSFYGPPSALTVQKVENVLHVAGHRGLNKRCETCKDAPQGVEAEPQQGLVADQLPMDKRLWRTLPFAADDGLPVPKYIPHGKPTNSNTRAVRRDLSGVDFQDDQSYPETTLEEITLEEIVQEETFQEETAQEETIQEEADPELLLAAPTGIGVRKETTQVELNSERPVTVPNRFDSCVHAIVPDCVRNVVSDAVAATCREFHKLGFVEGHKVSKDIGEFEPHPDILTPEQQALLDDVTVAFNPVANFNANMDVITEATLPPANEDTDISPKWMAQVHDTAAVVHDTAVNEYQLMKEAVGRYFSNLGEPVEYDAETMEYLAQPNKYDKIAHGIRVAHDAVVPGVKHAGIKVYETLKDGGKFAAEFGRQLGSKWNETKEEGLEREDIMRFGRFGFVGPVGERVAEAWNEASVVRVQEKQVGEKGGEVAQVGEAAPQVEEVAQIDVTQVEQVEEAAQIQEAAPQIHEEADQIEETAAQVKEVSQVQEAVTQVEEVTQIEEAVQAEFAPVEAAPVEVEKVDMKPEEKTEEVTKGEEITQAEETAQVKDVVAQVAEIPQVTVAQVEEAKIEEVMAEEAKVEEEQLEVKVEEVKLVGNVEEVKIEEIKPGEARKVDEADKAVEEELRLRTKEQQDWLKLLLGA